MVLGRKIGILGILYIVTINGVIYILFYFFCYHKNISYLKYLKNYETFLYTRDLKNVYGVKKSFVKKQVFQIQNMILDTKYTQVIFLL